MKKSQITPERVADLFDYNKETGEFIRKFQTSRHAIGSVAGFVRSDGYVIIKIDGVPFLAHRLVWLIETGEAPGQIDHVNRVRSDNRFANLRSASASENQANTGPQKSNRWGVKGIFFDPRNPHRPFGAKLTAGGKRVFLGYFATKAEASDAYYRAAVSHWGEFAGR